PWLPTVVSLSFRNASITFCFSAALSVDHERRTRRRSALPSGRPHRGAPATPGTPEPLPPGIESCISLQATPWATSLPVPPDRLWPAPRASTVTRTRAKLRTASERMDALRILSLLAD